MARLLVIIFALFSILSTPAEARGSRGGGSVHVRGYYRKNGTYVQPHSRTAPNGTKSDNWSTQGNVNPITGTPGTKPGDVAPAVTATPTTTADTGVSCTRGQLNNGKKCVAVGIPQNGMLDESGHGWRCKPGFSIVGGQCVASAEN